MRLRLKDKELKSTITAHCRSLHAITDDNTFAHAMMLFYLELERLKEPIFAAWFKKEYDHDGIWLKWHSGGSIFKGCSLLS